MVVVVVVVVVYLSICLPASLKTKLFCETSSIFEVAKLQNKAILRDLLQEWKVECRADGLVPMRVTIFPFHLSQVLRLPGKVRPGHPLSGNQAPDLPTCQTHVSCTAPATQNASLQILFKCPTPASAFETATEPSRFSGFWGGAESLAPATQNKS